MASKIIRTPIAIADAASWYCAIVLIALILLVSIRDNSFIDEPVKGIRNLNRPCDEIYVVGEGETLNTISDKCGDPFIVEQNPHIHDPDDVFPGLVIKITPQQPRKFLSMSRGNDYGAFNKFMAYCHIDNEFL